MSNAIFIAGYYRSGTSALSGALQRAGVKFYNEADANEHNPLGFYEIPELIEFDVDLFTRLGVDWTDVRGLPAGWEERADLAAMLTRLEEILRRRFTPEDTLWGLKHPHLCRSLPLYERAARQAGNKVHVVHIFRDPWTAAASQAHKNGLTRAHALLLWMSYVTSAEAQARHLPRAWLTYQDFLAHPRAELLRLGAELNLQLGSEAQLDEASAYLTAQLNRASRLPADGLSRPLRELVEATWEAICKGRHAPALWDEFAAQTADLVGFLTEIGASRGRVIPALGGSLTANAAQQTVHATALRAPERVDDGARTRLAVLQQEAGALPSLAVIIVAPTGRAASLNDTLESLHAQFLPPACISIVAADEVMIEGVQSLRVEDTPEAVTRAACAALNEAAARADYVAIINAGDIVAPDACQRFALLAGQSEAAMLYCDEIVPRAGGAWVRHKPGFDITRLRQAAYIGDWVWYRSAALRQIGGFDPECAGAEEYDVQLRLAETGAPIVRLPETLFTRSAQSRRDDIKMEVFCARAAAALKAHLDRCGQKAEVQNRQHPGLFHHMRLSNDPGTSIVMLCDGGDIPALDGWLQALLGSDGQAGALTGPIILAGAALSQPMQNYLIAVSQQEAALEGKVLAVPPAHDLTEAGALAAALALVNTAHTVILDVRAQPAAPRWLEGLRARLADPGVVMAGARTLVPVGAQTRQMLVQGPIVIGADTRLGAGHLPDDPGPGGWLLVDQEASAIAPPGLLARTAALQACTMQALSGDALWIDICAQLRTSGARLVWTPDVSFIAPPEVIHPDAENQFRKGSAAAQALPWADPYHHPALSLHGDLLAPETRTGLIRSTPTDRTSLLLSGPPVAGAPVLNAVRALRRAGIAEADWAPEFLSPADLGRRDAAHWLRINPLRPALPHSPPYTAIYTAPVEAEAVPALLQAAAIYATSPGLVTQLRRQVPPSQDVTLWRPALSPRIWRELNFGKGLNTKPRIIWFDEGIAPPWLADLINETLESASWIVVERAGADYTGALARIKPQESEFAWAQACAELGPQICIRPAHMETHADAYPLLLAAAAGCHILADERLDLPESIPALRLPPRQAVWVEALKVAITNLKTTLEQGARARAAALALPGLEAAPPPWSGVSGTAAPGSGLCSEAA